MTRHVAMNILYFCSFSFELLELSIEQDSSRYNIQNIFKISSVVAYTIFLNFLIEVFLQVLSKQTIH